MIGKSFWMKKRKKKINKNKQRCKNRKKRRKNSKYCCKNRDCSKKSMRDSQKRREKMIQNDSFIIKVSSDRLLYVLWVMQILERPKYQIE